MTLPETSDIELFASSRGFVELEPLYDAIMGDHREWVHVSEIKRMVYGRDTANGGQALFVRMDVSAIHDPVVAREHAWRKVKL